MKLMIPGLVWAAVACAVPSAAQTSQMTREIVSSYLQIQAQLASDRVDAIKEPAQAIAERASKLGQDGVLLARSARAIATAGDLKSAREAFGPLSDAVIARVKADGAQESTADLKLAYCSMAKRSWLQRDEQIRNPYYGSQMPTCGEFRPLR